METIDTSAVQTEAPATDQAPLPDFSLKAAVEAAERARILEALALCGGNQVRAAKLLQVSRRTLTYRLAEYGMTRPRRKR
jgi:DNA-binding NtrC family response regulator